MMAEACDVLIPGDPARGPALILSAPISFWGGIDPATGSVIDPRHPDHGAIISGTVLFLPGTIGSSSASAVLMELVHQQRAPAAMVLHEPDAILLIGLLAAAEMGWQVPPALRLDRSKHHHFAGKQIAIDEAGEIKALE
jgi:predicted aconitase with swiveling domain